MQTHFISQHIDITNESWQSRSCSIAALWMALKSLDKDFPLTPDELLQEGLKIHGYSETGFWKHASLAILAHNYGLAAYLEEFKSEPFGEKTKYAETLLAYGVTKIFNFLKDGGGCVIVSVPKNFTEITKPHSVLLHSVKIVEGEKYFIYNDSEKESAEEGKDCLISLRDFQKHWRKLAIFLSQPKV